jgi:hypothetical protein
MAARCSSVPSRTLFFLARRASCSGVGPVSVSTTSAKSRSNALVGSFSVESCSPEERKTGSP